MSTFLFLLIRSLQILRSSAYSFAVQCSPSWFMFVFLREDWGEFQNGMYVKGGRKYKKSRFYRIYIETSHLGHNVIKKAFK